MKDDNEVEGWIVGCIWIGGMVATLIYFVIWIIQFFN